MKRRARRMLTGLLGAMALSLGGVVESAEPKKAPMLKPPVVEPDEPLAPEPKAPRPADGVVHKLDEKPLRPSDREHWAYQPLQRPALPAIVDPAWANHPIDRFIRAQLAEKGLEPQPSAEPRVWLRRVTFDLTGLPPTPQELEAFERACAEELQKRRAESGKATHESSAIGLPLSAFAAVVDRLLSSRAYGERWAQHWLDLARFAETDGFEHDKVRPNAWRYRDWVIEAFTQHMPLDEFIHLQIAGDELRPDDPHAAIATGFLLAGPDMPDINLRAERRHMVLNEITSTVGSALLGLQLGCAQCHDHKYDPISQADFYRLRAIFEPANLFSGTPMGRVVQESGEREPSYLMLRGDFRLPGPVVEPAFPRIANLSHATVPDSPAKGKLPSGRRVALARWLTSGAQPLTPRVLVNWVWQHHFGYGLSRSPSDFGIMGDEPTHGALLDHLAFALVESGWNLRQLHRQIVLSSVYRQASGVGVEVRSAAEQQSAARHLSRAVAADPQNLWLARMNRRRLDGEAIRDAMLSSADRLNDRRGGPGIMPPLPKELLGTLLKGQWQESPDKADHDRRSVYLFVRRNLRYPLFEAFDRPDTNASCPRRNESTTAPQALYLLNSDFSLQTACALAGHILGAEHAGSDAARIDMLYRRTLGRAPTARETDEAQAFLLADARRIEAQGTERLAIPSPAPREGISSALAAAWVDLCLAMFNLNEFLYLD